MFTWPLYLFFISVDLKIFTNEICLENRRTFYSSYNKPISKKTFRGTDIPCNINFRSSSSENIKQNINNIDSCCCCFFCPNTSIITISACWLKITYNLRVPKDNPIKSIYASWSHFAFVLHKMPEIFSRYELSISFLLKQKSHYNL